MSTQVKKSDRGVATRNRSNLNHIIADLRNLHATSEHSRNRDEPMLQLPSRDAVISITNGLVAALFPRHFGPPGLTKEGTDFFVGYTVGTALRSLEEQVRRELQLESREPDKSSADQGWRASEITDGFAAALPKVRALLESDIHAAFEGDPAAKSFDKVVFCYPGITAIIRHRLAHELYSLGTPMLARIISEIAHSETAMDIHPGAEIGESFFIDHGTGVVIGETSIIGRHVRLYQAVTPGAKRFEVDENGVLIELCPASHRRG